MTYQPNWSDPRCRQRAIKALTFVEQYTRTNRVNWISVKEIYKHMGNTSRDLGRWLKELLLEPADPYWNWQTGQCKRYRLRAQGLQALKHTLGLDSEQALISPQTAAQLATGDFDYQERSGRLYTAAQYIPKRHRGSILANHGYRYHYDIQAAAPTLLLQRAQLLKPSLQLCHLASYVAQRQQWRERLSLRLGISQNQVKTAINSILQGGVLSTWFQNKTFMALNYDRDVVIRMNADPDVVALKRDIAKMWRVLKEDMKISGRRIGPRDKAELYRNYEGQVGSPIRKILKKNKIKHLWMHDGWSCDQFVDPIMIETTVRQLTGFKITLDWGIYEHS